MTSPEAMGVELRERLARISEERAKMKPGEYPEEQPMPAPAVDGLVVVAWNVAFPGLPADPTDSRTLAYEAKRQGGTAEPLVRQSEAAAIIQRLTEENEALRKERDEAQDSSHNWHHQCEAIATILDLHEPECLGFAGEVRSKFESAEARIKALEEVSDARVEAALSAWFANTHRGWPAAMRAALEGSQP